MGLLFVLPPPRGLVIFNWTKVVNSNLVLSILVNSSTYHNLIPPSCQRTAGCNAACYRISDIPILDFAQVMRGRSVTSVKPSLRTLLIGGGLSLRAGGPDRGMPRRQMLQKDKCTLFTFSFNFITTRILQYALR